MAKSVRIVEVGLRDGLQNEKTILDVATRVEFAQKLTAAGIRDLEIGAFVSPKWVPQMASSKEVVETLLQRQQERKISDKVKFSVLVPNVRGMEDALQTKIREVALFAACSESFSKKNMNASIDECFESFKPVVALAKKHKIKVRGYLSVCFACPFEGQVPEKKVIELVKRMSKLGVYEISIGDTIGAANPGQVESLIKKIKKVMPVKKIAGHFHDTRGQALANILAAYKLGVHVFDSSIGGLGGCPYAPGATGNVATEDVVFMLHGMGIKTGIDLRQLVQMNEWIAERVQHPLPSRVGRAGLLQPRGSVV